LPAEALPQGQLSSMAAYAPTDAIPYRALVRDDFRAARPPAQMSDHASVMGAYTCANVVPVATDRIVVERDGTGGYLARPGGFSFRAEMDRDCSWWNDSARLPPDYVLEHEQIHFAIVELAARDLARASARVRGRGRTPQAALDAFQAKIQALLGQSFQQILERNTHFDEETSGRLQRANQRRWSQRMHSELAGRRQAEIPE